MILNDKSNNKNLNPHLPSNSRTEIHYSRLILHRTPSALAFYQVLYSSHIQSCIQHSAGFLSALRLQDFMYPWLYVVCNALEEVRGVSVGTLLTDPQRKPAEL